MSDYEHWGTLERSVLLVVLGILTMLVGVFVAHLGTINDYGHYQGIAFISAVTGSVYLILYLCAVNSVNGLIQAFEEKGGEYDKKCKKVVSTFYIGCAGIVLSTAIIYMRGLPLLIYLCAIIPALLFVTRAIDPFIEIPVERWLGIWGEGA